MLLWILITALTLIAILYVCIPFLRSNLNARDEIETEKALYEARLKELDNEFTLGRIDETSLKAAKTEEARKLLKLSAAHSSTTTGFFSGKLTLLATAVFIPLFSIAIYTSVGSPEVAFQEEAIEETGQASIEQLLEAAERRLEQAPDDLRGWLVVAPVYARQGKYDKAIAAYKNAIRLSDKDPELTFALAEVLVEKSQGLISDEALSYAQKTVALNEDHASAKFMLGIAAFQKGNNDEAIRIWQALIDSAQGNEPWVSVVQQRIDDLNGKDASTQAPQLSKEVIENAAQLSGEERLEMINQMVSGLAEKLEEDPTDKESWARLIRSYIVLGKFEEADTAIKNAAQRFSDDAGFVKFAAEARNQISRAKEEGNQ